MQIYLLFLLCFTSSSILNDIDNSFADSSLKETSPTNIGFIDDLENVKEEEVRLGDSPFMIDPETLVEVGTMNALVPEDEGEAEEAVGKEMDSWDMDLKSKVEVGTMSEEELGDALAYEPEIQPRREDDFDEFGVERSTGYSIENEVEVGDVDEDFEDLTLQNDEPVYIQDNEESKVGEVEESSEEYNFDKVHDVEEGTYLNDDELKQLDEEYLPKLEPMDEPEIKDLDESEVGEDPNVKGDNDEEPVSRVLLSHYEMDPTYEVEVGALPDNEAWLADVEKYGYKEPEDVDAKAEDEDSETQSDPNGEPKEVAVGDMLEDEVKDAIKDVHPDHYENDINGEASALEPKAEDDTKVGDYDSDKKEFFDMSGMHDADIVDDKVDDSGVTLDKEHEAALKKEQKSSAESKKTHHSEHSHSTNHEQDLSLPTENIADEEAVGMNAVELKNTYKDTCGEEYFIHFDRLGNRNVNPNSWYNYDFGPFQARLHGWSHTRHYAGGFLCNGERGCAGKMRLQIHNVDFYQKYEFKLYMLGLPNYGEQMNRVRIETLNEPWTWVENVKWPRKCHAANKCPYARKGIITTKRGPIVFRFHRDSHHVHLSGISIRRYCGPKFQASLAGKNGIPARIYEFQRVSLVVRGGNFKERMRKQCNQIGMKPLCDHPHYCRNDHNSIYLGQSHHLCHYGQARSGHMPQGFKAIAGMFDSTCCYTAGHGGNRALCTHGGGHAWKHPHQGGEFGGANSFVCARYAPFTMTLQHFRNVQKRTYEFEMVQTDHYGGHYAHVMRWECARRGMKPVCDHPHYCQNDWNAVYIGQHHHLAYRPHRKHHGYFPKNFRYIWQYWDNLCSYSGNRGNALCNIPLNTHSWRHSSEYSGAFMCARAWRPEPFKRTLGARNGVPRQRWEFQPYYIDNRHGNIKDIQRRECGRVGMKPICDHPSYCRNDYNSYYLGQNHHLAYPGHRNNKGYWPNGWMQIRHQWDGTCAYTAGHGGANTLCNIPANTHSWRNIYSGGAMNEGGATSFVCGTPASFIQKLGAKNGVPSRTYEFQTVSVEQRGGNWLHLGLEECSNIGMRPICDHPSYCKNDHRSLYIGQTWHIAYPPHRNNMGLFPEGWNLIRNRWDKLCSYTGNHGGGRFLCNVPQNTHSWQHPANGANTIMCGKIAPFEAALGPKNGVPGRSYEFQMVTYNKWHAWSINSAMVESCKEIGMKPVCDHPSYCKNDPRSIYIGQSHHIAYKPHRNNRNYFPRGWEEIKDNWNGICSYTAHHGHNGHRALCNINFNTHSWQHLHWGANTWMCARIKGFTKVLGKRKNIPRRRYEFRIVESQLGGMRFDKAMLAECSAIGMKPICDHPNYCRNNPESLYLGQDHHLAYKPHRNAKHHWPSGWNDIKDQWNGLCAYTVNHGTGGLCNIPLNTHSWQKISSFANRFMCGRVAPFQAWLDAGEKSLGERRYSFRVVSTGQRGGKMSDMMRRECRKLGMKPVCDHPKYCKNDRNALYIGQKHHISHPKQRNDDSGFPKGWSFIKDNFHGTCLYTGRHGGGKALCNYPFNTHSWRNLDDNFNTFVCGKVLRFKKKLGSKNKVPENDYVFEMVKVGETAYGKRFSQVMIDSCKKRGMKPICDHPNYCRSDSKALYLGQTHHLAYWPHRKNDAFWPSGWKSIRSNWDGMCAYTAHHGTGALCNIPKNTHSWQNPSDIANTFMCGRIASLKVELGSKNGVQAQRYEFRVVRTDVRSGKFSDVMLSECQSLGMKPVCDHRSYCRNDKNSIYLGQDHHMAYPGHRNNLNFFPSGWNKVKHLWDGLCTYTSNRGAPGTTLCNIPSNTHSWQKLSDKANGFVCARIANDEDDGKATEAACQLVKGFRVTPQAGHTKKSKKKSWRRCERWCERNANMENACQYENGNCMLMKPEANDGKFEDDYSGYGCLFTRYADLSTWTKHSSGIKISKDKFSATLPKGRQLESKRDLARNLIVSAKMKASSCAGMSFFNTKKSKSSGLTLMTGEGGDKAKAMPSGKSLSGIKRNRWNEVRIASYFWGVTEYYVNGKLVDRSDKSKDSTKGSVMFLADCSNIEVKNVKIWEVCGGKGVEEGNKDEHAKGKAKHAKINEELNTCNRKHNSLKIDVINQQKTERVNNGQGNHWCRNRDNMKGERDNMKSQRDKTGNERDGANKEQQAMEAEKEKAKENKSTMHREMESGKRLLESTKREHQKNARECLEKSKSLENKNKAEYAKEEDRRKREEAKLNDDTKAMNSKWRAKMSSGQKVKGREELARAKLKSESEKLDSKTRECNEMIRNAETLWTKKTEELEDKKMKEGKGVDHALNKLTKEFKKKILDTNELTRTKIGECKKKEKEDIGVCEKEKEDQNSRWTQKYRKLEEYWGAEMLKEKTEGGLKTQKKYKKELARCKAMGAKEKSECKAKYKQCKVEGEGYRTRMVGHERLEKIAIKMKKEADKNFALVKTKYETKLEKYQTCVRETEELDAKHNAKHTKMQAELEGHLIQHAACMKRHDQSLKLVNNYKKMFNMIRTSVTRLREQSKSEFERARKLQTELMAYQRKCGRLENDWRSKFDKVEHAAIVAERKQKDAEDDYVKLDKELKSLDKRYKFLQKAKGEDEKTWRLRITKQKQENRRTKELEEKKMKDRQKRWEVEKKKLVKKEDETHDEYDARVKKAHDTFQDKEKEFEAKWQSIVHKISRKNGESTKEFRKRVKRAYKKYRQVSDYVGRFKQAKKMHQDDVALYTKQFKEQTDKAEAMLKDYSSQLKRWKSKADNEKARLVDAVRRQNRDLREAKKAKLQAERARKLLEQAKKDGEDENKEKIKKSLKLKEDASDFDDKWKEKVEKNQERLQEREKKANEYWTKRFDIEKKAAMGATNDKITDELRGVLGKRYESQIKELEHKTKGIEKDEAHKVSGWKKRLKTLTTKETNHVKELENGNLRAYRQVMKAKKLQKENDKLINDLHMTCNDHEGKADIADDFEKENSRISALIRRRENEMEEVRDEFKKERNAFRERKQKAKQEIKDLSMVAAHLQEKLEQIQKLSPAEAHVSKASSASTIQHAAPHADNEPFYTQSQ